MGELRWYCTVCSKKSKKSKLNMKKIGIVHSIELHRLYVNQVFSQLSCSLFRQKIEFFFKNECFSRFLEKIKMFK
jgi:hypothetical protein